MSKRHLVRGEFVSQPVPNSSPGEDAQAQIRFLEKQLAETQNLLKETEQRFFLAEENARIGVWDYDVLTGKTYLSPGWSHMLGVPHDKAPTEWADWAKVVHPNDLERLEHAYKRSLRDPSAPYEQEFRMRHTSGRYCWVLSRAKALCDEKGNVVRLVGVHIDVTALKEIHEQMRDREQTFEELSLIVPYMFSIADRAGRLIFVSHAWTEYSGMTLAETNAGDAWMQLLHPEDRPAVMANWEKILAGDNPPPIEARFQRHSDGLYRWHSCQSVPMRRKDGVVERWYLAAQDVHEYRTTVAQLAVASNRFRTLFDSNVVGIVVCDREVIREANDNFLQLVGYTREDLTAGRLRYRQMTPTEFLHLDVLRSEAYKKHRVIPPFEKEYIRKDGSRVPVLVSCVVMETDPYSIFALVIDLTERKRAENELRSIATQLRTSNEDLERFAYVASHDLTEPARTLSLYLELLTQKIGGENAMERRDILQGASEACDRLTQQVRALTEYTGAGKTCFEPSHFDARLAVDEALERMKNEVQETHAQIQVAYLPKISADRAMMTDTFTALLGNALKYRRTEAAPDITIQCVESQGNWVFSIADNGQGISDLDPDRLFSAAAGASAGNRGLGLALCRKMMDRHSGRIWAESQPGRGTTIFFSIPKRGPLGSPAPKSTEKVFSDAEVR